MCHMSHIACHMSCVLCHMSYVLCHMSCVTCRHVSKCFVVLFFCFSFFWENGRANKWRVCYQRGLPRLVFLPYQHPLLTPAVVPFRDPYVTVSIIAGIGMTHSWRMEHIVLLSLRILTDLDVLLLVTVGNPCFHRWGEASVISWDSFPLQTRNMAHGNIGQGTRL